MKNTVLNTVLLTLESGDAARFHPSGCTLSTTVPNLGPRARATVPGLGVFFEFELAKNKVGSTYEVPYSENPVFTYRVENYVIYQNLSKWHRLKIKITELWTTISNTSP